MNPDDASLLPKGFIFLCFIFWGIYGQELSISQSFHSTWKTSKDNSTSGKTGKNTRTFVIFNRSPGKNGFKAGKMGRP